MTAQLRQITRKQGATLVTSVMIMGAAIITGVSPPIASETVTKVPIIFAVLSMMVSLAGFSDLTRHGGSETSSATKPRHLRKWYAIGFALFILGLLMLIAFATTSTPYEQNDLLLFLSMGLLFAGGVVLITVRTVAVHRAMNRQFASRFEVPARVAESFKKIEPDKSFETNELSLLKKGNIYILVPRLFTCAYFVKVSRQSPIADEKLRLPFKIFRKKYFTEEIDGLPVAKAEGEYRIPVDVVKRPDGTFQEKYANVSAIVYLVPRYDIPHRRFLKAQDLSDKFETATILKIMEQLSNEGSNKIQFE